MAQPVQQAGPHGRSLMQITGTSRRLLRTVIVVAARSIHGAKCNVAQDDLGIDPHTALDAIGRCREFFLTVGRKITICHGAMIGTVVPNHNHILYAEMWGRICNTAGAPLGWRALINAEPE